MPNRGSQGSLALGPHNTYLKTNKNDFNDVEAICEAASRPTMRYVSSKTVAQQDVL